MLYHMLLVRRVSSISKQLTLSRGTLLCFAGSSLDRRLHDKSRLLICAGLSPPIGGNGPSRFSCTHFLFHERITTVKFTCTSG